MPAQEVLLVTSEPALAAAVTAALSNGKPAPLVRCRNLHELSARLQSQRSVAALVDLEPQPQATLGELEQLVARFAGTRFVLFCTDVHSDLMLTAMNVGARHLMRKQDIPAQLRHVLDRLVQSVQTPADAHGAVVTVLSAGGGCGSTTLAVNIADEIRLATHRPVLLVDLDTVCGGAGLYLGLKGSYGIADVLAHSQTADPQLITSTALEYMDNLHVLLSPASIRFSSGGSLDLANLPHVIEACKQSYACTVFDAPRVGAEAAAALARQSTAVLIIMQLTVKDIRLARELRAALVEQDVPTDRIMTVANRHRRRHSMIDLQEARAALGYNGLLSVGNDFRIAVRSLNYGQLLSKAAPMSSLRRDVRRLAGALIPRVDKGNRGGDK